MARRVSGSRPCTRADARFRLEQAKLWLEMAELALGSDPSEETETTVAAGCAVLAGIAAADAICCAAAGKRYRGEDHRKAADFLQEVTGDVPLGKKLRELVDLKDAGHYGLGRVAASKARMAVRRAHSLLNEAKRRVVR